VNGWRAVTGLNQAALVEAAAKNSFKIQPLRLNEAGHEVDAAGKLVVRNTQVVATLKVRSCNHYFRLTITAS
jgi:hypothetical protein